VRAAADPSNYREQPVGAYLAMPCTLVFSAHAALWGFAMWGRPSRADLRRMVSLLAIELEPRVAPHLSLVDTSRLETGDSHNFAVLTQYLQANWDAFKVKVTRLALVRPPGLVGATVAGFFEVAGAPYPVRVFRELSAAATWLRAPELARQLDAVIVGASALPSVLLEVRQWLEGNLVDAELARAAAAMARAPRSLQRHLAAAGTSFQRELDAARVRVAKRQLAESNAPLTEIAYDVGCASPQHFSALFRRVTGHAPSGWRARRR
jgi:AraC-like DNA-binding protein